MGVSIELELITCLAQQGFNEALRRQRCREELLSGAGAKLLFRYMRDWYQDPNRKGTTPTLQDLREHFPTIILPDVTTHTLDTALDLIEERYVGARIKEMLQQVTEADVDLAPRVSLAKLRTMIANIQDGGSIVHEDFAMEAPTHVKAAYEMAKKKRGLLGTAWPWETPNIPTQGIQAGDTVYVIGASGAGKTNVSAHIVASLFDRNQRIALVCGNEMSSKEFMEILSCCMAKVSLHTYRMGKLSDEDEARLYGMLDALWEEAQHPSERSRIGLFTGPMYGVKDTVAKLEGILQTYNPDAMYIDALYNHAPMKTHDELVTLTCDLAKRTGTKLIVSWQQNQRIAAGVKRDKSRKSNQSDFFGTAKIYQIPQFSICLDREDLDNRLILEWRKARRYPVPPMLIHYEPGKCMDEIASGDIIYEMLKGTTPPPTEQEDAW